MTGDSPAGGPPSGNVLDHLRELFGAGLEYFQARATLAGIEAKEALLHFAIIIGLFVLALAVIVFGYLFLWMSVAVLLAKWLGIYIGWSILLVAVVHFAVAAGAAFFAVMRLKRAVFAATLGELKKDRLWLNRESK
jgi:uncharacterized membrane protein YqjE